MFLPSSIRIETPRTWLRKVDAGDIPFVFAASQYPGFCDGMVWSPPATVDELVPIHELNLARWESGEAFLFTIESKEARTPLGRITARRKEGGRWNLGFWAHPAHQGQGYMTEAAAVLMDFVFSEFEATGMEAACATWNHASRRVLEKIGMKFVRREPEGFQKAGEWVAEDLYEIGRGEWESRRVGSR